MRPMLDTVVVTSCAAIQFANMSAPSFKKSGACEMKGFFSILSMRFMRRFSTSGSVPVLSCVCTRCAMSSSGASELPGV